MTQAAMTDTAVRPFIKWAGGKGQLLPELSRRLPKQFGRYHEPFVGGGAFFFYLYNHGLLREGARLSDSNPELIGCYQAIKEEPKKLIDILQKHEQHRTSQDYFLEIRNWDRMPDFAQRSNVERAARMIFLNRTCYNGLYRLNQKGEFNAPYGHYKNPMICDPDNIWAVHQALQQVDLAVCDFGDVQHDADPGDFVYFDPPYIPVSQTASFTSYTAQSFGPEEHRRLAKVCIALARRNVLVMLSNSDTPLAREIYLPTSEHRSTVYASRKINCDGLKRGVVEELIVCSYPVNVK